MGAEVIILPIIFGVIFGIFYLYISARNKERLALIDKGAEASIFYGKERKATPIWKVVVINFACLLMGIGLGTLLSELLVKSGFDEDVAIPGMIFLTAGAGLLAGFFITKKVASNT